MKIYKYSYKNRPLCVDSGGFAASGENVIGFGTAADPQYEITVVEALDHFCDRDWLDPETGLAYTQQEKHDMAVAVLTSEGVTVTPTDEADYTTWLAGADKIGRDRERAYLDAGLTDHELIVALWERVMETRPTASDALQTSRTTVKTTYPLS